MRQFPVGVLILSMWEKSQSVTIYEQMKGTEQHLPVVLFIVQFKVILTFETFNAVYYAVQGGFVVFSTLWIKY